MRKKDRPRSTQRRALGAALLSGVLGVAAISGAMASGSPAQNVTTLADTSAAKATFPSTTSTSVAPTTTPAAPATTTPTAATPAVPATAPALASPDDVAAALRYLAATQPAPEPAAAPAPAPTGGGSVEDAIATYFGDVYDKAIRVARCESGLNPSAVSAGGGNWGLFQINTVHRALVESMGYSWDQILDPYVNAAVARHIYDNAGGWGPWGRRYA
jgi:hypothetical protein